MNYPKKISIFGLLAALCAAPGLTAQDVSSISVWKSRPQFQVNSPELLSSFRGNQTHDPKTHCNGGAVEFVLFGGKSTNSDELARYFLPFNKKKIVAGEFGSTAVLNGTADVIANYFGVWTSPNVNAAGTFNTTDLTYQSEITLCPEQKTFGIGFAWRQSFAREGADTGWFFALNTPLMRVQNNLGFKEKVIDAGGGSVPAGFVGSMQAALLGAPVLGFGATTLAGDLTFTATAAKVFKYGKICPNTECGNRGNANVVLNNTGCGSRRGNCDDKSKCGSRWGLGDIEIRVGYESTRTETCYGEAWFGIVAPTGNKPTAEFLFEPVVGNNKHFGFILGTSYGFQLWQDCEDRAVMLDIDTYGRYLLSNTQRRSFDLKDKQWSRYLWVYPSADSVPFTDIQPGINYFTQEMRVHPRFERSFNSALSYRGCRWDVEAGYNFYARSAEKVCLMKKWNENVGIAGFDLTLATNVAAFTANNATISKFEGIQCPAVIDTATIGGTVVPTYIPVKETDINLASAATPAVLSQIIYGTIGGHWDEREYPAFVNIGGSYEFGDDNVVMNRWLVWAKAGFSF